MRRSLLTMVIVCVSAVLRADVDLNGNWAFALRENMPLEEMTAADFAGRDVMPVPGCWDVQPKWYLKRGTGCYRRTFSVAAAMKDAVLVVDGMGLRAKFTLDGHDLGLHVYPYARLEIPVGPLAAGEHEITAAVDNLMDWPRVKLARPYYDFYFYGGFYHGVRLVEKEPKIFVRTLDWKTKTVEVEIEGGAKETRVLKDAKLWSDVEPCLTTIEVAGRKVRFGLRQVEAREGKIWLNGRPIFLKGVNRHESSPFEGSATSAATMLRDLQNLKALGGNFIRAAHYQQCEQFLDLCDEMGVLVWEESLGWGNGQGYVNNKFPPSELMDEEFCALQVHQTREMVRASFNHPCVIIQAFLNECNSAKPECKELVDKLIGTIRAERSGRLVSFACNITRTDICHADTDLVAFNAYPGTIPATPGSPAALKAKVEKEFNDVVALFRRKHPGKPIIISESGCGGAYGWRDANASINTEEYQDEYLRDIMETLWANPDVSGFAIWQMNDGRTRERYCELNCSAMFGSSVAGIFDIYRRPKKSVSTVRDFFARRAAGEKASLPGDR